MGSFQTDLPAFSSPSPSILLPELELLKTPKTRTHFNSRTPAGHATFLFMLPSYLKKKNKKNKKTQWLPRNQRFWKMLPACFWSTFPCSNLQFCHSIVVHPPDPKHTFWASARWLFALNVLFLCWWSLAFLLRTG